MLEYLGIFAALTSWVSGAYLLFMWRGHKAMSISEHAASSVRSTKFFAITMLFCTSLFYVWTLEWLSMNLKLNPSFDILVYLSAILVFTLLIFPDSGSTSRNIHRQAAFGMAFLYLPMSLIIILSTELSLTARVIGTILFGYMLFACLLFLFYKKSKSHYLVFQVLYIVAFQCVLLSAGYF